MIKGLVVKNVFKILAWPQYCLLFLVAFFQGLGWNIHKPSFLDIVIVTTVSSILIAPSAFLADGIFWEVRKSCSEQGALPAEVLGP